MADDREEETKTPNRQNKDWQIVLLLGVGGVAVFCFMMFINPVAYMRRAVDIYIAPSGVLGLMVTLLLLSYILYRQYRKRKQ